MAKPGSSVTTAAPMMEVFAASPKNDPEPKRSRRRIFIIVGILLVFLYILFSQRIADFQTVTFSAAPTRVKTLASKAGLNLHGQAIFLRTNPELVDADELATYCPHATDIIEYGCYVPSTNHIYILDVPSENFSSIMSTSVAHETLHAAWNTMSDAERNKTGKTLTDFYHTGTSTTLRDAAKPYTTIDKNNPEAFVDELHSLAGSEVDDPELPAAIEDHFDAFFSDRSASISAKMAFDAEINGTIAGLKQSLKKLNDQSHDLDTFKANHLDPIKYAMQVDLAYGDITTYNRNVEAYNHNLEIYKQDVASYNNAVDTYNSERQTFLDTYSELFPGHKLPVKKAT